MEQAGVPCPAMAGRMEKKGMAGNLELSCPCRNLGSGGWALQSLSCAWLWVSLVLGVQLCRRGDPSLLKGGGTGSDAPVLQRCWLFVPL